METDKMTSQEQLRAVVAGSPMGWAFLDLSLTSQARLRAVVAVDMNKRVQCQQPGCKHSVYAAVHVVEEDGRLLVLGSTCFVKRYGSSHALGHAQYGGRGGRLLTEDERLMLIENTQALLAHFEAQAAEEAEAAALAQEQTRTDELQRKQQMLDKLQRLRAADEERQAALMRRAGTPGMAPQLHSPWDWQMERTSVALFTAPSGACWVRVQHRNGSQKLTPWPPFEGWECALPVEIGIPDTSIGAISVNNIVQAIQVLHCHGFRGPVVGRWQDVLPRQSRH
jgi:hypothetical protein